jgi:hypothetical protein
MSTVSLAAVLSGSGPLWSRSSFLEVLGESRLSGAWGLKHAVYWFFNRRCGSSKISSQNSLSIATTLYRDPLLSLSIISSYLICVQQAVRLARGFWSLSLLHGCEVCTFICPCPTAHINCTHVWDMKSNMFLSWQKGSLMGMQAMSDKVVFIAVYHHCFSLGNHTHSCQKAEI